MKVFENPILSKNFMYSNLLLNDKGLWYRVCVENKKHLIFLTDVDVKILHLLEIEPDAFEHHDENAYIHISASPWVRTEKFLEVKIPGCIMLDSFAHFLANDLEVIPLYYELISVERLEEFFGIELTSKIKEATTVLQNFDRMKSKKFNGRIILKHLPNYDPRKFQTSWPKLLHSFKSRYELMRFVVMSSVEEIVDRFVEVNGLNIQQLR